MGQEQATSFGYWLRRRRRALDVTQAALADRVGCVVVTIKKIEQDARRPSLLLAERIADALGISGTERDEFLRAARSPAAAEQLALDARPRDDGAPQVLRTFLFTDIEGSTRLWERYPAAMARALARHDAILRQAIGGQGGEIFKTVGDAFCVAFSLAPPALTAAMDAQRGLATEDWQASGLPPGAAIKVRMALHTCPTERRESAGPEGLDYVGPGLNRIARLLALAHGGQVLLSLAVAAQARDALPPGVQLLDLGPQPLKDLEQPEQVFQGLAADLPAAFPPLRTAGPRPANLPAPRVELLGRELASAELTALLRGGAQLVTLTGPGGSGKTTLALHVGHALREAFPDGVFFVDLAPLVDRALVPDAIALAVGAGQGGSSPLEGLRAYLAARRVLLVLDNVEQVVAAAPLIGDLLASAPKLAALATSRAPLRLRVEHEYPLPPLALPPANAGPDELAQSPAVRLFVQRAQAARPSFSLAGENAAVVAAICRRLDGLPLAIELAAARLRLLTPTALLKRLGLALLSEGPRDAPARQRTLRETIAWSVRLLREPERRLFAALGAFVGGASLEAIEAVAEDGTGDVLDGLAVLVEHSLLLQAAGPDGEPRFFMLETIREYAVEQLAASGAEEAIRRRHASHFLALAEFLAPKVQAPDVAHWSALALADADNLLAVMGWAAQHDGELALRMGAVLLKPPRLFWRLGTEVAQQLDDLLPRLPGAAPALRLRAMLNLIELRLNRMLPHNLIPLADKTLSLARAHGDPGLLSLALCYAGAAHIDDPAMARALGDESAALARSLGDSTTLAEVIQWYGFILRQSGDQAGYYASQEELLALAKAHGLEFYESVVVNNLGERARAEGDYARAAALLEQSVALERRRGVIPLLDLGNLAGALLRLGRLEEARTCLIEVMLEYRRQGFGLPGYRATLIAQRMSPIEGLAGVAAIEGLAAHAARLLGAAQLHIELSGEQRDSADQQAYDYYLGLAREQLSPVAFATATAEGRALSLAELVAAALAGA